MITINGKEYGFFYSIGAHVEIDDFIIANPAASMTEGVVVRAIAMNKAYNAANGTKNVLTREMIYKLPNSVFERLSEVVTAQEKADSEISVELEEPKGKNVKSAAK